MKIIISLILCIFSSCFIYSQSQEPLTTYLSWQRNPESTMTIHWITSKEQKDDTVAYRELDGKEWTFGVGKHRDFPENNNYLIHIVELTHLKPRSIYQFQIGKDENIYKFQTMPNNPESPIRFVVGGDMYHDSLEELEKTSRRAASENPMFALIGGDIAYAYSSTGSKKKERPHRWLEFLTSWKNTMVTSDGLMIPIIPAMENHDVDQNYSPPQEKAFYFHSLFSMPGVAGYNLLDFSGYMTVFLLDSGHANPISGAQTEWLSHALCHRAQIPHKFALYHVPAWPSVRSASDKRSIQIRLHWVPLFEKHELHIAFENHNHAYKRSPLIFQEQANSEKGVLYIGDGAWGVGKVRTPKPSEKEWYLAKTAQERHFLLVTLKGSDRQIKAINSDGVTFDAF